MIASLLLLAAVPSIQSFVSTRLPWSLSSLGPLKISTMPPSTESSDLISKIKEFELLGEKDIGMGIKSNPSKEDLLEYDEYILPLQKDIDLLLNKLGEVIKREDEKVYEVFESFRAHAVARSQGDLDALGRMIADSKELSAASTYGVVRALTQTLNLINAAEVHHRTRRLRQADIKYNRSTPLPQEDSIAGTIENIMKEHPSAGGELKEMIYQKLLKQKVDFVLTAHPTEVNRRTLLRKYRAITDFLAELDRNDLTPYERSQVQYSLKREIASIWGSDEIRRQKPTPQQESRGGLAILESVVWDAVPSYLRKLDQQCKLSLGKGLPVDHVPINFSSWMGGDRDGNPNVTPMVTFEVAVTQRMQVARLLLNDVVSLYKELAVCKGFSPEMIALAEGVKESFDKRELYRRVLGHIKIRLLKTIDWCEKELLFIKADRPTSLHISVASEEDAVVSNRPWNSMSSSCDLEDLDYGLVGPPDAPLFDSKELVKMLVIMHKSLIHGGYEDVADGLLTDIIRRVAVFGLTLAPLDIRQESTRHMMAIDAITRYLGIGSYAQWDEATKISWLQNELSSKRPLFSFADLDKMGFDDLVLDTIKTLQVASILGPGSLGAYVISQAKATSDVLAVMLLQKQVGMTAENGKLMRVVPLFETLTDLNNAPDVVDTLFSLSNYIGIVKGKQEIMVGYSDSAKDAGRLAACWAQYESQEKMVKVAQKYGVELTFFHGKGGTVGRGGNPACKNFMMGLLEALLANLSAHCIIVYRAVLAHPPGTINGRFRVTEQGEMITQNFGSTGIAERTLDIYTAAVLAEQFITHVQPVPEWREQMMKLSAVSCESYRKLIEEERFINYFRQATPNLELGSLNIGSRPTKRNPKGGIESLRAIPWTFAWTQTRMHLPAWMGVGEAFDKSDALPGSQEEKDGRALRDMYNQWPFFREMVDLIAMTLSKTDISVSANYELQLVGEGDHALRELGAEIRKKLIQTRRGILQVTGCDDFSSGYKLLQMSMRVRYPYVDPLNIIQTETMARLRGAGNKLSPEDKQLLEDTLVVSINGIAQGMKNSG